MHNIPREFVYMVVRTGISRVSEKKKILRFNKSYEGLGIVKKHALARPEGTQTVEKEIKS